jgi:RimJ/RimL family protein N-acetyltransferase
MEIKTFGDKKIIIRQMRTSDVANAKKFQNYINLLIGEEAMILMNKKFSLKEERKALEGFLKNSRKKNKVLIIAEHDNQIVGLTDISLDRHRRNHIGIFGISIRAGYRGIGLGKYIMEEVMKLAKTGLDPKPKMIQLEVYANNKPAIGLYKRMGFRQVAKLPKQIQHKGKLIDELVMVKFL